jgi:queuine tRNA-ribosyltransferase subunit QTRTD1
VDADAGADDTKVNLWAVRHRLDGGPLVHGCSCFTCQNHSRAYVHHLLHTHEMLASVLLEMHNTHWWLGFFAAMREAIQQGRLQQYVEWFNARRQQQQQPEQPEQHAHKPAWHPHEQSA